MSTTQLEESARTFADDPSAGRSTPTVTAELANGHARLSAGPFNWDADLPPAVGGGNVAPSPTAYLLGALAACGVVFLQDTLAPEFGVEIDSLRVTAACGADLGGLLGVEGRDPALTDLRLEIQLESSSDADRIDAMHAAWRERCPIYLALLNPNEVTLTIA